MKKTYAYTGKYDPLSFADEYVKSYKQHTIPAVSFRGKTENAVEVSAGNYALDIMDHGFAICKSRTETLVIAGRRVLEVTMLRQIAAMPKNDRVS